MINKNKLLEAKIDYMKKQKKKKLIKKPNA